MFAPASDDEALLQQAMDGDCDALATLLERHGGAVRQGLSGAIPKRWQSVLSLDDVMQQTYLDAFLDIHQFHPKGDGSFSGWVTRLAKRNLLDALRMLQAAKRGGTRRPVELSQEESYVALYQLVSESGSTPSRMAAKDEAKTALERAIEQLPASQRLVVRLYDLEGRDIAEVGATLKRSPGAVYMLRARGHHRLRELLGGAWRFLSDAT